MPEEQHFSPYCLFQLRSYGLSDINRTNKMTFLVSFFLLDI